MKYKVRWIQQKKRYTFSFYSPESALELAVHVLKNGHTLLSVDQ